MALDQDARKRQRGVVERVFNLIHLQERLDRVITPLREDIRTREGMVEGLRQRITQDQEELGKIHWYEVWKRAARGLLNGTIADDLRRLDATEKELSVLMSDLASQERTAHEESAPYERAVEESKERSAPYEHDITAIEQELAESERIWGETNYRHTQLQNGIRSLQESIERIEHEQYRLQDERHKTEFDYLQERFGNTPERIQDRKELAAAVEDLKAEQREDILRLVLHNEFISDNVNVTYEDDYQFALNRISQARERYGATENISQELWKEIANGLAQRQRPFQEIFRLSYILNGYFPDNQNPSPAIQKIRGIMTRREADLTRLLEEVHAEYEKPPALFSVASENVRKTYEEKAGNPYYGNVRSLRAIPEIQQQAIDVNLNVQRARGDVRIIVDTQQGISARMASTDHRRPLAPPEVTLFNPASWY